MMKNDLASIRDTALRCREEGLPLTECALRRLTQSGDIPACRIGKKSLLYWANVVELDTVEVRYVIDCPMEVAENTDAPLFLNITLEGVKYQLVMR